MTINSDDWIASDALTQRADAPKYQILADEIAAAIARGALRVGDKLPTHRALSWKLSCTVGTITRAYAEAQERGLIDAAVGRGTFVKAPSSVLHPANDRGDFLSSQLNALSSLSVTQADQDEADIFMRADFPPVGAEVGALKESLVRLMQSPMLLEATTYQPYIGHSRHRASGVIWSQMRGVEADLDRVVVTLGGNNGVMSALAALTRAGDAIGVEALTYPGIKALATLLGVDLVPMALDEDGLIPDALEEVCKNTAIKAVYLNPTLHNPTNTTMSDKRRREVAAILERHGIPLLEDDIYGPLAKDAPKALCSYLSPDLGYYVTAVSKALAPGLRVGYVVGPTGSANRIASAMRSSNWMASPITAEIASDWIETGASAKIMASHQKELAARTQAIRAQFPELIGDTPEIAMHSWVPLPDHWRVGSFISEARQAGVLLPLTDSFVVGDRRTPNMIRISYSQPRSSARMLQGLQTLSALFHDANSASHEGVI